MQWPDEHLHSLQAIVPSCRSSSSGTVLPLTAWSMRDADDNGHRRQRHPWRLSREIGHRLRVMSADQEVQPPEFHGGWRLVARAVLHVSAPILIVLALALLMLILFETPARANTDPSGAYQTEMTIDVPPYQGLEPRLHLVYNSAGGNGWLGVGWQLVGLSEIERSSPGRGAPAYDQHDVYYLDGAELVPCKPAGEGKPATDSPSCRHPASPDFIAFASKVESFQRIAFDPKGSGAWYIWDKRGTKMTYRARLTG